MIMKNKNKLKLEIKSKILVLGLILIILVGLFSPVIKVSAANGTCTYTTTVGQMYGQSKTYIVTETETQCLGRTPPGNWIQTTTPATGGMFNQPQAVTLPPGPATPASQTTTPKTGYQLLAPLPNPDGRQLESFDTTEGGLGKYLNLMIKIFIGLCAVLSVVMIVIGGLEYMTSELAHTKEAGKEKILGALFGLIIALGAYALLYTINPNLLKSDVNIPTGTCSVPQFTTADDCAGKGVWMSS